MLRSAVRQGKTEHRSAAYLVREQRSTGFDAVRAVLMGIPPIETQEPHLLD